MIGVALNRLSLLATRQDVFNIVSDRSPQTEQAIQHLGVDDLALLYNKSIDLDALLLTLAFHMCMTAH